MERGVVGQATFHEEGTRSEPPVTAPRRWWVLVVRLAISVAMLGVLLWRVPKFSVDELLPDWNSDTALFLALAAALTLAGIVLSTLRWRTVLSALGQDAKLRRLLSYNLAGLFVSNVLPTTIGGDVLRVSRLSKENGESAASFASVVLERLTGWLVLPVHACRGAVVRHGRVPAGLHRAEQLHLPVRRRRGHAHRRVRDPERDRDRLPPLPHPCRR
jgi:hypothetical protein